MLIRKYVPLTVFILLVSLSFVILAAAGSMGQASNVGPGERFSTIQAAINAAQPGEEIYIDSGTYYESLSIDKSIKLIGKGNGAPVIDSRGYRDAITISAPDVVIEGLEVRGGPNGIRVNADRATIRDNHIHDSEIGVLVSGSQGCLIEENEIDNNSRNGIEVNASSNNHIIKNKVLHNRNDGILVTMGSHSNEILENEVCNNGYNSVEGQSCNAITVYLSDDNIVAGNTMTHNGGTIGKDGKTYRLGDAVMLMETSGCTVKDNTMTDNHYAVWVYRSSGATVENNCMDGHYYCMVVEDSSDSTIKDNRMSNGGRNARIDRSNNIRFIDNELFDGIYALTMDGSTDCLIDGNILRNSKYEGIMLNGASGNTFRNNRIANNNYHSMSLYSSGGNTFYLNDFVNNRRPVNPEYALSNSWNSPEPITYEYNDKQFTGYTGNKWDDARTYDNDGDGISDSQYLICEHNIDSYPLMGAHDEYRPPSRNDPVSVTETPDLSIPTITPPEPPSGKFKIDWSILKFPDIWLKRYIAFEVSRIVSSL